MPGKEKKQSNPTSEGGLGTIFETRVQAAFVVLMLSGRVAPCLPPFPIIKLKLQGSYAGFETDDFIAFTKLGEKEAKLLAQIKHDVSITKGNRNFVKTVHRAWNDFKNKSLFNPLKDSFALITGPLDSDDINHVRPVLEWARYCENEAEFFLKINKPGFASKEKKAKIEVFRTVLTEANGADISEQQLWSFLKSFHLIGYDLDQESGGTRSLLLSLIAQYTKGEPSSLWTKILDAVQTANQNAGTVTLETLPEEITSAFSTADFSGWRADLNKLKDHGEYILQNIRTKVGAVHIPQTDSLAQLFDCSESSGFVLVSGERGAGKSSLIRSFADAASENAPIFCLRTEDLDKPHLDNVFSAIGLQSSLADLEAGFALVPKKYLLIESLEKLLELSRTSAFNDLLQFLKKQYGWTVIATCRDYAYQQIVFHYLQPSEINFTSLVLHGFTDEDVQSLCQQHVSLQQLIKNKTLKTFLHSPFYAELAFRVLGNGGRFSPDQGEREFIDAAWDHVIAKEQERENGMPVKRRQTFIDLAVQRAKKMVYGVPEKGFDSEVLLKLEGDNLVRRDTKKHLVSPAHDVFEDWALERYIEEDFQKNLGNQADFLAEIGNEPAITRAFRLWLHQKLRLDEDVEDFVYSVLTGKDVARYWQDETIAAVLQGDNPDEFLRKLKKHLLANEGELLQRFCFILRTACQTPDQRTLPRKDDGKPSILFLKPHGNGWQALICFLFNNKDNFPYTFRPHIAAVLKGWAGLLRADELLPVPAHEVGLLALYLLNDIKKSHGRDDGRKEIIRIIIKTSSAILEEFAALVETDILATSRGTDRPPYADDFCELIFSFIESAFVCAHHPDLLIKLAYSEWFVSEQRHTDGPRFTHPTDRRERFGLHEFNRNFLSASGVTGPFRHLLNHHPAKAIDFIIDICNRAVEKYAHTGYIRHQNDEFSAPVIEQVEIQLNDSATVKQYCSGSFWIAYRGISEVPPLLECALMALENWLIVYTEHVDTIAVERIFDHILRNSNSVMPTAVLASVATGFPNKAGKAALPFLKIPELYSLDRGRFVHERGGRIMFPSLGVEPLADFYTEERRAAALRPWRKEHLETLVTRLQFSKLRETALSAVDKIRSFLPDSKDIRFLLHRIDSRRWKPIQDKKNNKIVFEPEELEPDLEKTQRQTQETMQVCNRFSALFSWADKKFKRESSDHEFYQTWNQALEEAKELHKIFEKESAFFIHHGGVGPIVAAAVFIRDYSNELSKGDLSWCVTLISQTIKSNADTDHYLDLKDVIYHDGSVAAANILPVLLGIIPDDKQLEIKILIVTALTHAEEKVRCMATNGIREHLWQRNTEFAEKYIAGAIKYARFEKENELEARRIYSGASEGREQWLAKKDAFRDQFARGALGNELEQITFATHSSWCILSPCLMIPDGSREPEHVALFSQMLWLFFAVEQNQKKYYQDQDNTLKIDTDISFGFIQRFATYLFPLHSSNFHDYIDLLKTGCETAPGFTYSVLLHIALTSEQQEKKEIYWQLWGQLSETVQQIALKKADDNSSDSQQGEIRKLIRGMLHADTPWQKLDYENQEMTLGKDLLLEFAENAGRNQDVFEALASLLYHFPKIFLEEGIHLLARHQGEVKDNHLISYRDTAFYLENAIQRFLQLDHPGPLPRKMHESCFILLNALVETASSRAYYLREHLIRSRKIL
ncbi:hypothetical protein H206_00763 [Candidatus Electrothrix aarhusensis]|uniref:ATP-binding protein n=1 Tax=Candidatus Electrothrix aarhusensis TaxID=1859131 RepID=A0A3S3QJN8_9BACT|nr:hypothetical protein H206_00763 [Candidatus Electrothrix aarhusensis]